MLACPPPDAWLRLDHGMPPELERHVDECQDCRSLAAMAARLALVGASRTGSGGDPVGVDPELVPAGTTLGRYVVRGAIGVGGMGIVLEGFDPELERTVALKLVRRQTDQRRSERARERVLDEAKAMARLSHPNVVAIHELIELGDERLIAMEYVDGADSSVWLHQMPRSRSERASVILDAGRGVAAAHEAGIFHRDIKPSNILIGKDARARVTDFGLAMLTDGEGAAASGALGTPGYMAPEVEAGQPFDARSDQYSFAVTAWEILHDQKPPAEPGRRSSAMDRVLRRALSRDPDARFTSMTELVDALERTTRRRHHILLAGGALAVAAAAAIVAVRSSASPSGLAPCVADAAAIAETWSKPRRDAWIDAMSGQGPGAAQKLAESLDDKWLAWQEGSVAVCEAKRRGTLSGTAATECLDSARRVLAAVVRNSMGSTDADAVWNAIALLPDGRDCTSTPSVARPELSEAAQRARDEIRAQLDEVSALSWLGKYDVALAMLQGLLVKVPEDDPMLRGEILYRTADRLARTGDAKAAVPLLQEGLTIAERGNNDIARLNTLILLIEMYEELGDLDKASALAPVAEAAAERVPRDLDRAARMGQALGALAYDRGQFAEAERHYRKTVALKQERWADRGGQDSEVAGSLSNLGRAVLAQGRHDEATELQRQALAMFEATIGPDHPDTAFPIGELGAIALERGDFEQAEQHLQRVVTMWSRALGPEHPYLSEPLAGLAQAIAARGQSDRALELYRQARALAADLAADHPLVAVCDFRIAEELLRRGQEQEALAAIEGAVALFDRGGFEVTEAHFARFLLAKILWRTGSRQRARDLAAKADAGLAKHLGPRAEPAAEVERWLETHR